MSRKRKKARGRRRTAARPRRHGEAAEPRATRLGSWPTLASEAEAARRHLAQASTAMERLLPELKALRESAGQVARLDLARQLAGGPDGGPLSALADLTLEEAHPEAQPYARAARLALERLASALGLEPVLRPGEVLAPGAAVPGEHEWLGRGNPADSAAVVVRSGWRLGDALVARPVVTVSMGQEREGI